MHDPHVGRDHRSVAGPPRRDAAVFLDLENLFGGYGDGLGERLEQLARRLPDMLEQITSTGRAGGLIGGYAVKRAYADWSHPKLRVLRPVMIEHAIEPRQVFAFGSGGKRNAADVDVVIDVLEIAYTRRGVTTFAILSGDGGFATLGRKLHELGNTFVVAAYPSKTAKCLRAVTDLFVALDEAPVGLGARLRAALGPLPEAPMAEVDSLPAAARALVERLAEHEDVGPRLRGDGIPLATLVGAFGGHLDLTAMKPRHGTAGRFLRFALAGTPWCLASGEAPPNELVLTARAAIPEGHRPQEDLGAPSSAVPAIAPKPQLRAA